MGLDRLIGTYEGTGAWYDSAGKTSGYRVRQTNAPLADRFEVAFTHDFDDGNGVAHFSSTLLRSLFSVRVQVSVRRSEFLGSVFCAV